VFFGGAFVHEEIEEVREGEYVAAGAVAGVVEGIGDKLLLDWGRERE
jgi:hypothetical protein